MRAQWPDQEPEAEESSRCTRATKAAAGELSAPASSSAVAPAFLSGLMCCFSEKVVMEHEGLSSLRRGLWGAARIPREQSFGFSGNVKGSCINYFYNLKVTTTKNITRLCWTKGF